MRGYASIKGMPWKQICLLYTWRHKGECRHIYRCLSQILYCIIWFNPFLWYSTIILFSIELIAVMNWLLATGAKMLNNIKSFDNRRCLGYTTWNILVTDAHKWKHGSILNTNCSSKACIYSHFNRKENSLSWLAEATSSLSIHFRNDEFIARIETVSHVFS